VCGDDVIQVRRLLYLVQQLVPRTLQHLGAKYTHHCHLNPFTAKVANKRTARQTAKVTFWHHYHFIHSLIEHLKSAQIQMFIKCSWCLADVLACPQKVQYHILK
jgi:hypothetical protein